MIAIVGTQGTLNNIHSDPSIKGGFTIAVIAPVLREIEKLESVHYMKSNERIPTNARGTLVLAWGATQEACRRLYQMSNKPLIIWGDKALLGIFEGCADASFTIARIPSTLQRCYKIPVYHAGYVDSTYYLNKRTSKGKHSLLDHSCYGQPLLDKLDWTELISQVFLKTKLRADQLHHPRSIYKTAPWVTKKATKVLSHKNMLKLMQRYEFFIVTHPESLGQQVVEAACLGLRVLAPCQCINPAMVKDLQIELFENENDLESLLTKSVEKPVLKFIQSPKQVAKILWGGINEMAK